jgi:hypothetical protein
VDAVDQLDEVPLAPAAALVSACSVGAQTMAQPGPGTRPHGDQHVVAEASCAICDVLVPENTGYECTQDSDAHPTGTDCYGDWPIQITWTLVAEDPEDIWSPSDECVDDGPVQNCLYRSQIGPFYYAQRYDAPDCVGVPDGACYNEPPSGVAVMDKADIDNKIRPTHFPGGQPDPSKSLFYAGITNSDLQNIFQTGLLDPQEWEFNGETWEKTFAYPQFIGKSSLDEGGGDTDLVTIVIEKFGDPETGEVHVTTMYPK